MRLSDKKNLRFMRRNRNSFFFLILICCLGYTPIQAQVKDSITDTQVEPPEGIAEGNYTEQQNAPPAQRIKLDGIAAVVGDYVILDSDVEKTLIDLKNQGATDADVNHCSLLGKLMEDRLYAHQAVQDSILVSDDEVNGRNDQYIQEFVQRLGSMEKVLEFYNQETVEDLREELYKINKLQMLSQRMQQNIVGEIEVTPEEVRQFFNSIPEDEKPVFGAELEIAQIVKKPEIPETEKQKVVDLLNEIKADVEDNGASFRVKAILYSQDPGSKSKGGFYSMTRQTPFVKEFKDVAFSLREGEISEPFESPFGFHIIFIEKVRGQELDLRHILIQPEVPQKALDAARLELDSIRTHIMEGKYTFAEAARNFSDEKETKFDGGLLRNPSDFSSRFELTKMDPKLYNQVRNLKDNEISNPILEPDPRGGPPSYKILMVSNRFDEHEADFARDYLKIQELALRDKQFKAIRDWMTEHIEETYISLDSEYRECSFTNNWLKE
jgi:peptidyl-prolyl cis-trans isomerase SurA